MQLLNKYSGIAYNYLDQHNLVINLENNNIVTRFRDYYIKIDDIQQIKQLVIMNLVDIKQQIANRI